MSTTENTTNQPLPLEKIAADIAPFAPVNTAQYAPVSNKSNPNLVMALVICLMLITGLGVAFLFNQNKHHLEGETTKDLSEKEELLRLIDAEKGGSSYDRSASTAIFEEKLASILKDTGELQTKFVVLKAGYVEAQEKLNQAANELQGNMSTISRLGSENTTLKTQMAQFQDLAKNAQAYQSQLQQLTSANREKDGLIASMENRPSSDEMEKLKKMLNDEQETKEELLRKIQELEQQKPMAVNPGDAPKVEELQSQNQDLRNQLQALQTRVDFDQLFIKSPKSLPKNAQILFSKLKGLEGADKENLQAAYTNIATEQEAQNLQQVKFAAGSSILNFTDQTTIKAKLNQTTDSDYLLVVGYASTSGDAASNETLSANRATAVASVVNQLKSEGQEVRAVYLGQTNRFSKEDQMENQLCEIWKIKK